jgi:hypothetical protein
MDKNQEEALNRLLPVRDREQEKRDRAEAFAAAEREYQRQEEAAARREMFRGFGWSVTD